MARTIINAKDAQAGNAAPPDSFSARLVKYIPAEVITLYLTMDSIIKAKLPQPPAQATPHTLHTIYVVQWVVFLVLLLGTPLYLLRVAKISKTTQIVIATISFAVWVFAVGSGGPFTRLFGDEDTRDLIAALVLPLYTFGVALIEPER